MSPPHLFASTLNVKQLPGSTEHAQEGVGAGWHSTPSYASWVTEIKTNLERCMVNGASTPSSSFSLALPSTHPHSSSPTISSTPTLPPTHLRDCGCCSIIATPHISTSLPLQTLIQRGFFFSSKLAVCVTKLKQGQTKKSVTAHPASGFQSITAVRQVISWNKQKDGKVSWPTAGWGNRPIHLHIGGAELLWPEKGHREITTRCLYTCETQNQLVITKDCLKKKKEKEKSLSLESSGLTVWIYGSLWGL